MTNKSFGTRPENDCAYGELIPDKFVPGNVWVKPQPNSLYDLTVPRTGTWSVPVLETEAANDS